MEFNSSEKESGGKLVMLIAKVRFKSNFIGLKGRSLGIIGFGNIGRLIAVRA
jgi:phosphoglycerate dehydrogenase-like enzyme